MKFRKKPVVIEAVQLTEEFLQGILSQYKAGTDVARFPHEVTQGDSLQVIWINYYHDHAEIQTLEGTMRADLNDWIITGVNGEKYPCKPDIFEQTYESVEA